MFSMALAVTLGLDSAQQHMIASSTSAGVVFSSALDTGLYKLPSAWSKAKGAKPFLCDKRLQGVRDAGCGSSPASVSCSGRRIQQGAELKTCNSDPIGHEVSSPDAFFKPALGWPVVGVEESEFGSLGKQLPRVEVLGSGLADAEELQEESVSGEACQIQRGGDNLFRHWIDTELRTAVQSGSPPPRQREDKQSERDNYYVNTGYAIRTLREELPNLFYRKLNFDIYRDDITFRDPMNTFSGIDSYKLIFWALRFHGRIFFRALWVDVNRVWQPHDKVIMVRWTVRGVPRVPWEAQGHFEGNSEYKLDKEGKIYEHKVDNVIFNSPTKYHAPSVLDLVRAAAAHTNPTPSFCGRVVLFLISLTPYLEQFTWIRFYWALKSTLVLNKSKSGSGLLGLNM